MSQKKYSVFYIERKILGWLTPVFEVPFILFWIVAAIFSIAGIVNPFSLVTWMGLGVGVAAWFLLLIAKWPQIRKLDLFTFGAKGLPLENQRLYKISYALLGLGLATMLSSRFLTNFGF